MYKKIFIICVSSLLGLFLFEFLYKNLKFDSTSERDNNLLKMYSLWSDKNKTGGRINIENKIWTYDKNNEFVHKMFIKTEKGWHEEFKYKFKSNNYGLNQDADLKENNKSVLFLGASVPEGWGDNPWFNDLRKEHKTDYQLVNGALHGTGVFSWRVLHDYLKKQNIKIEKILIFIHGDFWINMPKTINKDHIECLKDFNVCLNINLSYLHYGMPDDEETKKFLNELYKKRNAPLNEKALRLKSLEEFRFYIREFLPASYEIYRFARIKFNQKLNEKELLKFMNEYKQNLIIVHLPQKKEHMEQKLTSDSLSLIKFIKNNGGNVYSYLDNCEKHFDEDYYYYEGHPNLRGYKKIKNCAKKALDELLLK